MSIFRVWAVSVDATQNPLVVGEVREEEIDTSTNNISSDCRTLRSVESRYEEFWNYLNFDDVHHNKRDRVKVLKIERISGEEPCSEPSSVKKLMAQSRSDQK